MKNSNLELQDETFEKIINLGIDDLMEMIKENPKFKVLELLLEVMPEEKDFIVNTLLEIVTSNHTAGMLFTHIATETLVNIIIAKISVDKKAREKSDESEN